MFSGGDSSGEGVNSLNQFGNFRLTAQTANAIDWASIAQQWIQMRDNTIAAAEMNATTMPDAPPPPTISGNFGGVPSVPAKQTVALSGARQKGNGSTFEEQGEADMDMDDEDDNAARTADTPPPPAPPMNEVAANIMQQPQQHWFMSQTAQTQQPLVPLPLEISKPVNAWPPRVNLPPPVLHAPIVNPTAHIPSLLKINVPNPNEIKASGDYLDETSENAPPAMDAAKRKILPAWIREGLEKMEREKQKQLERQQSKESGVDQPERDDLPFNDKSLLSNEETVKTTNILASDSSGNEDDVADEHEIVKYNVGSASAATAKPQTDSDTDDEVQLRQQQQLQIGKSYEQKLADLMIVVRRTLTELLLEETNNEIQHIANEALKARKNKASSVQVIRKSALTSITSKLGLAAYEDSSSDNSDASDNENNNTTDNENNVDSEEELKANIRAKRRNFAKTSEEIEERIVATALREEQKLKYYTQAEQQKKTQFQEAKDDDIKSQSHGNAQESNSRQQYAATATSSSSALVGKGYERDFGETTESKLQHSNGKQRQRERASRKERTTRFSDNKDSRGNALSAAAAAAAAASSSYMSQMQNTGQTTNNAAAVMNTTPALYQMMNKEPASASNLLKGAATSSGSGSITNVLIAAETVLEKATKSKSSPNVRRSTERRHRQKRRSARYSSDDSDDSETTASSTSNSSRNSKYSRSSSTKHNNKRSRYRHHDERSSSNRHSNSSRRHRHHNSSSSSHRKSSRYSRSRSRSPSRSSYSSTSRRRH